MVIAGSHSRELKMSALTAEKQSLTRSTKLTDRKRQGESGVGVGHGAKSHAPLRVLVPLNSEPAYLRKEANLKIGILDVKGGVAIC